MNTIEVGQIKYNGFVSIDIETTGLNAQQDEIIQITAVKIFNDETKAERKIEGTPQEFNVWVKPLKPVPKKVAELIRLKQDQLENALDLEAALKDFDNFIEDLPLVSHNIDFDKSFLDTAYRRILHKDLINKTFCTLRLARILAVKTPDFQLPNYKFNTVATRYLGEDYRHYSNNDENIERCYFTALIFIKIREERKKY